MISCDTPHPEWGDTSVRGQGFFPRSTPRERAVRRVGNVSRGRDAGVSPRVRRRGGPGTLGGLGGLALALTLAACSGAAGAGGSAGSAGSAGSDGTDGAAGSAGQIELAVTTACEPDSSPDCVPVGGGYVLEPDSFETAGVASASATEENEGTVMLELEDSGAQLLQELTSEAAGTADARLLIRAGGELLGAPMVAEPIDGGQVQLSAGPDRDADELLALIQGS